MICMLQATLEDFSKFLRVFGIAAMCILLKRVMTMSKVKSLQWPALNQVSVIHIQIFHNKKWQQNNIMKKIEKEKNMKKLRILP